MEKKNVVRYAGIEGGGQTWKVSIAEYDPSVKQLTFNIVSTKIFNTTTPKETLDQIREYLTAQIAESNQNQNPVSAIGVACFGPIDPKEASPTYGYITTTPKPNWAHTDVLSHLRPFNLPLAFDTDVNAPAYFKSHKYNLKNVAYVTVGTGIGVGIVVNGEPVHGALHPEMGHFYPQLHPRDNAENFKSHACKYHDGCLESFVCAGAIAVRSKRAMGDLAGITDDDEIWERVGWYLGQLCANLVLTVSPEKIVMGGGIMRRKPLLKWIRQAVLKLLNGYIQLDYFKDMDSMSEFVVYSPDGDDAGIMGALDLARRAHQGASNPNKNKESAL